MTIQILPNQISKVWDSIKYAIAKVERLSEADIKSYYNTLLVALLNDKAQCFVRLDENKQLIGIAVTRLINDEVTGDKALVVSCLYSFKSVDMEFWKSDIEMIKQFARTSGCKKIIAYSTNERVYEIVQSIGFTERFRSFIMEV